MNTRFVSLLMRVFFTSFVAVLPPHGAHAAPPADLQGLVSAALADNPDLKGSEARWQMFRNRVVHAGRFEDPMLMLKIQNGIVNEPFNFRKDTMTQKVIGISQLLPFWGKRDLRSEVAAQEAESFRWLYEERKLELKRLVKEAYYQIYLVDRQMVILDKNIGIMADFITLAETRYAVGKGVQQDIFKAQVERSRMLDMRLSFEQQRTSLQTNLNALLYRPADTPVGPLPEFALEPLTLTYDELRNIAGENRPLLKSLGSLIEKGKSGRKLAEKEFYPDFNVSLEYMQRDSVNGDQGLDMYSLGVTFNLPVYQHHRHEMVAEADASVRMATAELDAAKNGITSGIADLLAQLGRRKKQVDLYRTGIIPQAEQSLESATIGYRTGRVDFLTLLDNRLTLYNYERELNESLADYQVKRAQLEALVGKEL